MTSMAPAWLKLNSDKKGYTVIKDRALTIKRIFDEAASGLGIFAITRRLNEKNVPHFGKSSGWRMSYIAIILRNRAVLGEFRPHKYVNGKRVPEDAEPIKGYYPPIVDEQTFDRVQRGLVERRNSGAGRKGKGYSSLFLGAVEVLERRCNSDNGGGPIYLENKGNARYLVCDNARSKLGCITSRWRYDHFENQVLFFLSRQIDLQSIVSVNKDQDKRYLLEAQIEGLEGKKIQLEADWKKWSNIADKIIDAVDDVAKELDRIARERKSVEAQLAALTKEQEILLAETKAMAEADIKALVESLQTATEEERYKVRSDLATNLKKVVARIDVDFVVPEEIMREWLSANPEISKDEIEDAADSALRGSFEVTFKNGRRELCYPQTDDPFDPTALGFRKLMDQLGTLGFDTADPYKAMDELMDQIKTLGIDTADPDKAIEEFLIIMKPKLERNKKDSP